MSFNSNRGDAEVSGGGGGGQTEFMAVLDDTATVSDINAALAAANTAGGGLVHLKAGLYLIDASIEMEGYNNVTLEGAGDGTILQPQAGITWTNSSVINAVGDGKAFSVPLNNVSANDTTITATTPANIASINAGDWITFQGTDLDGLQDSEAHFITAVDHGTGVMTLKSKVLRTMTSVNASDITRGGVANKFKNFKLDMSLTDMVGSHWGLYINNTYANRVENVTFVDATLNGHTFLRMNTSHYTVVEKCRFTNAQSQMIGMSVGIGAVFKDCVFDKIATDPVFNLSYVPSDVKVINCVFRNCNDDGFKMSSTNGSGKRIQLIGNSFSNCVGNGIQLVGGAGHVVEGNTFHGIGNGAASVLLSNTRGASVIGNTMENGGLVDVWLSGSNCVYNTVKGNTFRQNTNRITNGAQLAAIYCDDANNNDLRGNTYDGTSGSYYALNGTTPNNLFDISPTLPVSASTGTATSLTSTSYADLTGMSVTFTTLVANEKVTLDFTSVAYNAGSATNIFLAYKVDSGSDVLVLTATDNVTGGSLVNVSFSVEVVIATAGSHTIKIRGKRDTANANVGGSTYTISQMKVTSSGRN